MVFSRRENQKSLIRDIMFCPECGIENQENAKYCLDCGSQIKPESKASGKKIDKKPDAWTPDPVAITIGACLIASMYLIPIFSGGLFGKSLTLSQLVDHCSSSILSTCGPGISWGFYIVWIFSIGLIVFGLCARK